MEEEKLKKLVLAIVREELDHQAAAQKDVSNKLRQCFLKATHSPFPDGPCKPPPIQEK